MRILAVAALLLPLAGCVASTTTSSSPAFTTPPYVGSDHLYHYNLSIGPSAVAEIAWAPGAVSSVTMHGDAWFFFQPGHKDASGIYHGAPEKTLLPVRGNGPFDLGAPAQNVGGPLKDGDVVRVLLPPAENVLALDVGSGASTCCYVTLVPEEDGLPDVTHPIVSGANVVDLEQYQQDHFPHRTPRMPNYKLSQAYFAKYFTDLGYTVTVDPYGLTDAACPAGLPACPGSAANIVAMKPGKTGKILAVGGHYDVVEQTTYGAFDNTSGTTATMEMARAMAPFTFNHTLMFALWGGEEDGTVGSEFWCDSHPQAVANIETYWNLDVIGMSWPAPILRPSPIIIAAGPDVPSQANDGTTQDPISQDLLAWAGVLQHDWLGYPDNANGTKMFYYEGIASGQANGYAAVNAQSDHTSFMKLGIPAYFIFNGDTLHENNPIGIHAPRDTIANMTKVAWAGKDADLDSALDNATLPKATLALERSFESTMLFPFYSMILQDQAIYTAPGAANRIPVSLPLQPTLP